MKLNNGESIVIKRGALKLIISYSKDSAKKDAYNREKGIQRLQKQITRGRLTKLDINHRSCNKFLILERAIGEVG